MRTWLEYREFYSVSGDKVYVERFDIDPPLWRFPLYNYMEMPRENWKVYGPAIRAYLNRNFYGGGHHYHYPFIKPSEIWIESSLYEEDLNPVYLRHLISRHLMKYDKLTYPQAELIGSVYETDLRLELRSTGEIPLKSFYPKKNSLTLDYAPPLIGEWVPPRDRTNTELERFLKIKKGLLEVRSELEEPEWDLIFEKLDEAQGDLEQLPVNES